MSDARGLERYPAVDDRLVEALLASVHAPCTAQQLAIALGWTLPRTIAALHRLARRLASTGQTLQQLGHQTYAPAPRAGILDRAQIARCARDRKRIDPIAAACFTARSPARTQSAPVTSFSPPPSTPLPTGSSLRESSMRKPGRGGQRATLSPRSASARTDKPARPRQSRPCASARTSLLSLPSRRRQRRRAGGACWAAWSQAR